MTLVSCLIFFFFIFKVCFFFNDTATTEIYTLSLHDALPIRSFRGSTLALMADPNRPNRPIRPRQGAPSSRRKRRVVIEGGGAAARPRDGRKAPDRPEGRKPATPAAPPTGPVSVESGVSVRDLSQALGVPLPQIIKILMGMGEMKTATQSLSDEEVALIGTELEREITI